MVSAWSAANGISLGQVKVDDKSNEITAIPLLINSLELSGCIVTIDAMGCQKDITQTIIEHDANYIIAIKENKKKNYQPAKQIIDYYQDRDEIINRVTRHVLEDLDVLLAENEKEILLLELFPTVARTFLTKWKEQKARSNV